MSNRGKEAHVAWIAAFHDAVNQYFALRLNAAVHSGPVIAATVAKVATITLNQIVFMIGAFSDQVWKHG